MQIRKILTTKNFTGCDACRARKVRCARENQDDPQTSCKHCIALGIPCTYDYQPKKRGPPNLYAVLPNISIPAARPGPCRYLRRLQEAAAAAAAAAQQENGGDPSASPPPGAVSPSLSATAPSATSPYLESTISSISLPPPTIPPSRYPIAADSHHHSYYSGLPSHGMPHMSRRMSETAATAAANQSQRHSTGSFDSVSTLRSPDAFSTYPLYNWSSTYKQQQSLPVPPPGALPPLSYYYRPHRLEDVAPRETVMLIINLFFDFVYPLTPCVHKPSFMADLHSRREERDPLFFALVMSTCASTLVQVPRSYLPMERPAVRKLAQICHEASRHISVASYDPPQSIHVVIRYL